ncbi:unnamed protein product [Rhizophagus irregularis]|nr:unnamed protein product [Rhizophagus irregularis]
MSKCRHACIMHQHAFFKSNLYHNIRTDNNNTSILNASGVENSKQSHGNLFLFLPSQYINKPIKHLKYTHGLDHPNYGFVTPYRIDRHDNQKRLISSVTFTNEYSPKVYHTVAPYQPYPDMFIPHKYRNIIPKDLIYNNNGNFIVPGSREWFTYMYNLHQSGTIPIPILTYQVTQYEYYAEQAAEQDRTTKA